MKESAATTIQNWWRLMCEFRCYRCGDLYKGNYMCDKCYWATYNSESILGAFEKKVIAEPTK